MHCYWLVLPFFANVTYLCVPQVLYQVSDTFLIIGIIAEIILKFINIMKYKILEYIRSLHRKKLESFVWNSSAISSLQQSKIPFNACYTLHDSPYSVRMRENMDQKNSEYRRFSRSDSLVLVCKNILLDFGRVRTDASFSLLVRFL